MSEAFDLAKFDEYREDNRLEVPLVEKDHLLSQKGDKKGDEKGG